MKINNIKIISIKLEKLLGKDFYSFLNHSKNYISAGLFTSGMSIITVPIFTRLLAPEDYGILAILSSFVAIFGIIYGLGMRVSVTRYYYETKNDFDRFLGSNLVMLTVWAIFLTGVLLLFSNKLLDFFQVPLPIIYIGIGIAVFSVYFQQYQAYLQASKNSKRIAFLTIFKTVINVIIAIPLILLMTKEKFYGSAYAMIGVAFIYGGYSLFQIWKISTINFNAGYIKYALILSLPVVFHLLSQYILNAFDQIIINQLVGSRATGLYSLAYKVGLIQNMVSMGMLRAWTPKFYENLNAKKYKDINQLASKFARLVYLSAFVIILFAREIVIVLADKKYHEALSIVPVIIMSYVVFFLYTMYVNFAFYQKKTKLIALFTIIAGVINIGLNYWLIPIYGYQVAAWTTLASYAVLFVLHYLNVRFLIKPEWITSLRVLLPNFGILIGAVLLFAFISNLISQIFLLLLLKMVMIALLSLIYFGKNYLQRKLTK